MGAIVVLKAPRRCAILPRVGEWRSLVAHLHGVQGAAGSNPVSPTLSYPSGRDVAEQGLIPGLGLNGYELLPAYLSLR